MTPEEEVVRAERCRLILEDPYVRSALDDIREVLVEQWRASPVKDTELREYLWGLFTCAHKFEQLLRAHIETGKLAKVQLDR